MATQRSIAATWTAFLEYLMRLTSSVLGELNNDQYLQALDVAARLASRGPTGPRGDQGVPGEGLKILGYYDTLEELERDHPVGNPGDAYLVGQPSELYIWDATTNSWRNTQITAGVPEAPATQNQPYVRDGLTLTWELLPAIPARVHIGPAPPQNPIPSDLWWRNDPDGSLYIFYNDGVLTRWIAASPAIAGPPGPMGGQGVRGPAGPQGQPGEGLKILGYYDTLDELEADHPTGNPGDAYIVGGDLYIWDANAQAWQNVPLTAGLPDAPATVAQPYVRNSLTQTWELLSPIDCGSWP